MGKSRGEWCDFHRACVHSTEDCWTLGAQLEGLLQQGHLSQYVCQASKGMGRFRGDGSSTGHSESVRIALGHPGRPPLTTRELLRPSSEEDYHFVTPTRKKGGEFASHTILTWANLTPLGDRKRTGPPIIFLDQDIRRRTASRDEPMVISVVAVDYKIEQVLVDQDSLANILFWSNFQKMELPRLTESSGVPIKGTVELDMVFGEGSSARVIPVLYTVVEAKAFYNIIMGQPTLNKLKAIVSTYHLYMKYPIGEGVGSVWADSHVARRCYEDSLKVRQCMLAINLDLRCQYEHERPHLTKEVKDVQVGPKEAQKTKIGTTMNLEEEADLMHFLRRNNDVFAWSPNDMPDIDPGFMYHQLSIMPGARSITQKKRKHEEKRKAIK
ncbi:hypothetical protein CR513_45969, partial [Mucuna pruriens]